MTTTCVSTAEAVEGGDDTSTTQSKLTASTPSVAATSAGENFQIYQRKNFGTLLCWTNLFMVPSVPGVSQSQFGGPVCTLILFHVFCLQEIQSKTWLNLQLGQAQQVKKCLLYLELQWVFVFILVYLQLRVDLCFYFSLPLALSF